MRTTFNTTTSEDLYSLPNEAYAPGEKVFLLGNITISAAIGYSPIRPLLHIRELAHYSLDPLLLLLVVVPRVRPPAVPASDRVPRSRVTTYLVPLMPPFAEAPFGLHESELRRRRLRQLTELVEGVDLYT